MGCAQSNKVNEYETKPYNNTISIKVPIKKYVEEICKEIIECYHCKEAFELISHEIKIHCSECFNFFHCHIAGKCECCSLHYCLDCVNPYYIKDDICKCNESRLNSIIDSNI